MATSSAEEQPMRMSKGRHSSARFSSLDELTFNRDFDLSHTYKKPEKWKFEPSYSGFAAIKLKKPQNSALPVNMMDTFISDAATTAQIVPSELWRTNIMVKHNPQLRGYVTDKMTNERHEPAALLRSPTRLEEHKLVHDHEHDLLVNITTPSTYKFSANSPPFHPLGRPATIHEPGRHRFFVSDVRAKIGGI